MKRTVIALAALAAAALMGASALAQDRIEIKIGAATAADHSAVFVGVERGIFARNGLDPKVVLQPTGVELINGLLNGAHDVSVLGSTPFITGVGRGMPLLLIGHLHGDATRDFYSESNSVVASAASGIKEGQVAALKGKKIGYPRASGAETHARGVMEQAGISPNDATVINLRPSDIPTALRNGDVDAVSAWEPWASAAELKVPGAVRVIWGKCQSCYDPGTILTTRGVAGAKPEALRRFMVAFAEAHQWLRQNLDAAAEINMRWIPGVDLDVMKTAIRHSVYDLRLSKNTTDGYNTRAIPVFVKDGRVPKAYDMASAIDPQFYLHAQKTAPQFFTDLPPIPENKQLR
jgi:NitT/TauT family transport system substrate-binding protein/sulfonate transport system substrate-binding protein